jgi:hypothetical protein
MRYVRFEARFSKYCAFSNIELQSLKSSGRQQNLEGQQQEAKGQIHDYGHGMGDRVQGTVGSAVAGVTGDKSGQEHYEALHDKGKTQQRGAEHDIQKQGESNY